MQCKKKKKNLLSAGIYIFFFIKEGKMHGFDPEENEYYEGILHPETHPRLCGADGPHLLVQ